MREIRQSGSEGGGNEQTVSPYPYFNNGALTVSNSTLSGNSANFGGGVFNNSNSTSTISNSTFSANKATTIGGGIFNQSSNGIVTLTNSTLSGNSARGISDGGGIYNSGGSTLNIANTIIANSTVINSSSPINDYDGTGTVNLISGATAANNLVSQGTFSWATTESVLNLGPLQNNGGPTETIALTSSTPAAAKTGGNATISNASPINGLDQRGFVRSSTAPSIGAYEFNGAAPATAPTVNSISPTSGSNAGGTSITITGTDFTGATAVTIGGTAATNLVVNSATSITVTTPAGTAGTASVLVTTPGGTNAANTLFTYLSAANTPTSPPVFSGSSTLNAVAGSPVSVQVAAAGFPAETNSNLFTNDFSAALPTSWTISDSASLTGGILQVTPASNNSRGIVTLPAVGATSPTGFSARFKLIVSNAGGAEGLSFNYGELLTGATLTGTAALETGMVSAGLVVTFGEFGDDRMEVRYNNKILSQVYVSFASAAGKPVDVTVTPLGLLTLTVDGKTITTVNLGADYVAAAKSTWQFAFAARTGTSNSQHAIDDLTIDALQIAYGTTANYVDSTFGTALPTGWNLFGNASLDTANNELILTPNAGSRAGALVLPALGATSPTAFSAQFDYRASDGSGANGTSFNYGVIPRPPRAPMRASPRPAWSCR